MPYPKFDSEDYYQTELKATAEYKRKLNRTKSIRGDDGRNEYDPTNCGHSSLIATEDGKVVCKLCGSKIYGWNLDSFE